MTKPGYLATLRLPGVLPVLAAGTLGRLAYGIVSFSTVVAFSTTRGFLAAGVSPRWVLPLGACLLPPATLGIAWAPTAVAAIFTLVAALGALGTLRIRRLPASHQAVPAQPVSQPTA
jgi:hypothetical protein